MNRVSGHWYFWSRYPSISPFIVHLHTVTGTLVAVVSQEELVELNFHKPVLWCLAEKRVKINSQTE